MKHALRMKNDYSFNIPIAYSNQENNSSELSNGAEEGGIKRRGKIE